MNYTLSAILQAHTSDVKDLTFLSDTRLASCSRDHSVIVWDLPSKTPTQYFQTHTAYVNALCHLTNVSSPTSYVVSAGTDHLILIHDVNTGECIHSLQGHTNNVCVLASMVPSENNQDMMFISGSWDNTARVWCNFKCIFVLKGHEQSVWGVLALDSSTFITSSADKTIKIWNRDQCIQTIQAHHDVARALCYLPKQNITASCSNDSTIKMWDKYGHLLHELYGHTSFVYKVTSNLVSEELVSCGEDRTVRIWKDATLHQTLTLPVISVWSVAVSPNGLELAAAGSDGHVYVFTRTPSNVADTELQNQYTLSLSQFAIPKNQIGDLKKDTLPGPEALLSPGNKEGQVIMIQTSSSVEAHQWSMAQLKWIKIGDVVDAIGNSRKQLHEGIEYDYVFDIDTGSGKFLKLPYNLKDNPYDAAHKFLVRNQLDPTTFLDQVANFIIENTKGVTLSQGTEDTYVDPYTGAHRYQATASQTPPNNSIPSESTSTIPSYNPWGTTTSSTPTPLLNSTSSLIPVKTFILFQQFNFQAIEKKIHELEPEVERKIDTTQLEKRCWEVAHELLHHPTWPKDGQYPALDLLRSYVLSHSDHTNELVPLVLSTIASEKQEKNALMAFRVLANMFQIPSFRNTVLAQLHPILVQCNDYRNSSHKHVRLSIATLLLNLSVQMYQTSTPLPDIVDIVALLVEFLQHETDSETFYRTVTAIGTLIALNTTFKPYLDAFSIKSLLRQSLEKETELRTLQAIQACLDLM